jgi:hypothetical protein
MKKRQDLSARGPPVTRTAKAENAFRFVSLVYV